MSFFHGDLVFFVSLYFDLFTKFVVLCFVLCSECHGAHKKFFFSFFFSVTVHLGSTLLCSFFFMILLLVFVVFN